MLEIQVLLPNAKAFARMERGLESSNTAAAYSILKDSVDLHSFGLTSRLICVLCTADKI
jgi:hypothetical protein